MSDGVRPATTEPAEPPALPAPEYHAETRSVRFWVAGAGGQPVGAILSPQVLQYRLQAAPDGDGDAAVAAYLAHRAEVDAAVLARLGAGSIEPVMLRENDFKPRPRA